jgi:hypothetical protein
MSMHAEADGARVDGLGMGLVLIGLLMLGGCGESAEPAPTKAPPSSNQKFEFEEGEPGRFAGGYVTVEVGDEEFVSNDVEVVLESSHEVTRRSPLQEQQPQSDTRPNALSWDGGERVSVDLDRADRGTMTPAYAEAHSEPSAEVIERRFEEADDGIDSWPMGTLDSHRSDGCDTGPHRFSTVEKMGAYDGYICHFGATGSVEQTGLVTDYIWIEYLAPEGLYFGLRMGESVSWPPDIAGAGWSGTMGCVQSDQPNSISAEYIDGLDSISFGFEYFFVDIGFTIVLSNGRVVGFEQSAGWSVSAGFFPGLNFPFSISVGIPGASTWTNGPIAVRGYDLGCLDDLPGQGQALDDEATTRAQSTGHTNPLAESSDSIDRLGDSDATGRAVAGLTGSLFGWLGDPSGVRSADNIPAGSQPDWMDEWFANGDCSDCPNTSMGHLMNQTTQHVAGADSENDDQMMGVGRWSAETFLRGAPDFTVQTTLQEGVMAATDALFHSMLADAAEMQDDPTRFISPEVVEHSVRADETVDMPVTADEVAELLGVDTADVMGAELCLSTFTEDGEVCGELDGDEVVFNYTPTDPAPIMFQIEVDLTGADGFDAQEVEDWSVQLARRMVTPIVDTPTRAGLNVGPITVTGSPVTLNAVLTDDNFRFVEEPATFRFYDTYDELLGEVESDDGRASFQFIPEPTAPRIDHAEAVEMTYGDDSVGIGYVLEGRGLSRDVIIKVDGRRLTEDDFILQVESARLVAIAPLPPQGDLLFEGDTTFKVENPGGLASEALDVNLTAPTE